MHQSPAFAPAEPQSIERLNTRQPWRITWQPWERPRKRSVAVPFARNDGLNSGIVIPTLSAEDWLAVTIEYRNDIDISNPFQQLDETS